LKFILLLQNTQVCKGGEATMGLFFFLCTGERNMTQLGQAFLKVLPNVETLKVAKKNCNFNHIYSFS
jgi:hypothetical protein